MISRIKEELLFAKAIRTGNPRVQEDILEDNRKAAIFWAVIQIVFWSLSLVMSRFNQEYIDCLPVYIIAIAISVASLICAEWSGTRIDGISISCGLASSEEFPDFNSIMKAADQRMYEYKQNYYRTSGAALVGVRDRVGDTPQE